MLYIPTEAIALSREIHAICAKAFEAAAEVVDMRVELLLSPELLDGKGNDERTVCAFTAGQLRQVAQDIRELVKSLPPPLG
jgi:hypothetical protein